MTVGARFGDVARALVVGHLGVDGIEPCPRDTEVLVGGAPDLDPEPATAQVFADQIEPDGAEVIAIATAGDGRRRLAIAEPDDEPLRVDLGESRGVVQARVPVLCGDPPSASSSSPRFILRIVSSGIASSPLSGSFPIRPQTRQSLL
jgi:hypothetical protein